MWKLCFKIWTLANAFVVIVFGLFLLKSGLMTALQVGVFSSLCSLPALGGLYAVLCLLKALQGNPWFSWMVLLLVTGLVSFASYLLFRLTMQQVATELDFMLPLSLVCGVSSVLAFYGTVHNAFEKFYYTRYENN